MNRKATIQDILCVLKKHSQELTGKLSVSPVQLSFPTDGKGVRVKVSVQTGKNHKIPRMINFDLDGDIISLPLEVSEDYQDYQIYNYQSAQ